MNTNKWIVFMCGFVMIFGSAIVLHAGSEQEEPLEKYYGNYISNEIEKSKSKLTLKTSRSDNLRIVAAKADREATFLTLNKEILIHEMIERDIGKKPYKIEYYLNQRFSHYYNCILLADSGRFSYSALDIEGHPYCN